MTDEALTNAVEEAARTEGDRRVIACAAALAIAKDHGVAPTRIGEICNDTGIRIAHCQLGCFK